ncbi:Caldesmon [Acipenser ruthenus]|uniref:Caldesmon n=1 Tax=Acipenser ruthenus TaxID=7906 RepID=A0A444UUY1_ACIRT|nr:Caldesmon [Acipenser ruthenus]
MDLYNSQLGVFTVIHLTRQWTVEDEEEVERERRRRIRSTSTTSEPPDSSSNEPGEQKPHSAQDKEKPEEADPENLAFLEMLKTRDERRKKRHLETLMRQKEGVEECQPSTPEPEREGQGGRVEAEGEGQRGRVEAEGEGQRGRVVIESKAQREGQGGRVAVESKAQREGQGGRLDTEAQKDSMGGVQWELRNSTGRGKFRIEGAGTETATNQEPVTTPTKSPPGKFIEGAGTETATNQEPVTTPTKSPPGKFVSSKLRISSRTIEEKLERLAMAAQDNLDFSTGISERINRWISKTQRSEKSPGPTDLRKVDISSKRNLWKNRSESSSASPSKR